MRAKNFIANLIECRQRVSTTPMDDLILSKHFLAGEFYWHIDACKIPAVKFITGGRLFVKYFSENQITLRLYIFFITLILYIISVVVKSFNGTFRVFKSSFLPESKDYLSYPDILQK